MDDQTRPESEPASATARSGWRDLRDGPPPKWLYGRVASDLARSHKNFAPPLHREDVIVLVGLSVAAKYFFPKLIREGSPDTDGMVRYNALGVAYTVRANPEYAKGAGFFWVPSMSSLCDQAGARLLRWLRDVLGPSLGGGRGETARSREIYRQWGVLFCDVFNPSYAESLKALETAFVNNVGGDEWDPRRREKLKESVVIPVAKLLGDLTNHSTEVLEFSADGLAIHAGRATKVLNDKLGDPAHLREDESLDLPLESGAAVGDLTAQRAELTVEQVAAIHELRGLRDDLDLSARHPQLNELADDAISRPRGVENFSALLRSIIKLIDSSDDAALKAAIVYEIGTVESPGQPRWGRELLARQYRTSPRKVELRGERSRKLLRQVRAA